MTFRIQDGQFVPNPRRKSYFKTSLYRFITGIVQQLEIVKTNLDQVFVSSKLKQRFARIHTNTYLRI
jgi:hypothetical protein